MGSQTPHSRVDRHGHERNTDPKITRNLDGNEHRWTVPRRFASRMSGVRFPSAPLTKPQFRHSFLAQRASHLDCRILPGAPQGHTENASSSSEIPGRPLCQRPTEGEQARDFAISPSRPPGDVPRHPALAVHAYGLSVMLVRGPTPSSQKASRRPRRPEWRSPRTSTEGDVRFST